ncbi:MAG TPA: hypothetical protein VMS65_01870, partial [Polyangiaceae bacterium]|nr:hypothetical protein [Polyangiaceae bacterium]
GAPAPRARTFWNQSIRTWRLPRLGGLFSPISNSRTLGSRLDRLIAVTIQERTYSVERLADIERRLGKLEERMGI